jgi:hypothetical protein
VNYSSKNLVQSVSQMLKLFLRLRIFLPLRFRRHFPPHRRFLQDLHGATSQKTVFFIVAAVKTSNPIIFVLVNFLSSAIPTWLPSVYLKISTENCNSLRCRLAKQAYLWVQLTFHYFICFVYLTLNNLIACFYTYYNLHSLITITGSCSCLLFSSLHIS